jgi:hypothetical protein
LILRDINHTINLNDTEQSLIELIREDKRYTEMNPVNTHLAITEVWNRWMDSCQMNRCIINILFTTLMYIVS